MSNSLKNSIQVQRALLNELLSSALDKAANNILPMMSKQEALDTHLHDVFHSLDHCKYLYVLDKKGVQISSTITRYGPDDEGLGRDRSTRPYMQKMNDETVDFYLSDAYVSRNKKRPSVTATQTIHDEQNHRVGFLCVDFDLRELPYSDVIYEEPSQWRQIKGDPVIRDGLFLQERVDSLMDQHIDNVLSVHEALMADQGVYHFQIHFSSSRSTIWHSDDPYIYRILTMDELSDTEICLAYPQRPYFERSIVPVSDISKILKLFKALRFADETVYLRSGSLNIVNGKIGLNFSCDGTHYLNYDEFLNKGLDFWFGADSFPQTVVVADELDRSKLDSVIEDIAVGGCIKVNKLLYNIENEEIPKALQAYSKEENNYIYHELKSIMNVYEGGICGV